jgi:hypothetical protein
MLPALVLAFIAGYAVNTPSTTAQSNAALPFIVSTGAKIDLVYEHGTYQSFDTVNCVVAEVQPGWVRCGESMATQRPQEWHSLRRVVRVIKRER